MYPTSTSTSTSMSPLCHFPLGVRTIFHTSKPKFRPKKKITARVQGVKAFLQWGCPCVFCCTFCCAADVLRTCCEKLRTRLTVSADQRSFWSILFYLLIHSDPFFFIYWSILIHSFIFTDPFWSQLLLYSEELKTWTTEASDCGMIKMKFF